MGIATGIRGKGRFQALKTHRMVYYYKALDDLLLGKTTPEYVAIRARKCDAVLRRFH